MAIEPISMVAMPQISAAQSVSSTTGSDFTSWLDGQMSNVNQALVDADQSVRELSVGNTDNLHQVMLSLEQAKLSFEMMVQVRNRMVEAYQEILRMRI